MPPGYCFILPTGFGAVYAAVLAAVLAAAVNYNNNLAFALGFILVSMFIVSLVHTHAQVKGLVLESLRSEPVFAGDMIEYTLFISSPDKDRYVLEVGFAGQGGIVLDVPGGGEAEAMLYSRARARGMYPAPELVLSSRYPFGICRAWHKFRPAQLTLVYPERYHPREEVLARFFQASGGQGAEDREEFSGIREYIRGDRPQVIAWKASAKGTGLRSKEFSGESGEHIRFTWHDLSDLDAESRLSMLASLVLEAQSWGKSYELVLPGFHLGPGSGHDFMGHCLQTLALYDPGAHAPAQNKIQNK